MSIGACGTGAGQGAGHPAFLVLGWDVGRGYCSVNGLATAGPELMNTLLASRYS